MTTMNADKADQKHKIRTQCAKICVGGTTEKPYYNILYFDPADGEFHIGFGSYCLDYVFKWLAENFEVTKPSVKTWQQMIKLADTGDFGFVCVCAVRYCLGRRTYAPGTVMGFIRPLLPRLDSKTLYVMARDIAEADNLGDAEIDAPMWAEFLTEIEKERKRRKSDENA